MNGGAYQRPTYTGQGNSGLGRFSSPIFGGLSSPYQPAIFQAPQLAPRRAYAPTGGLLSPMPDPYAEGGNGGLGGPGSTGQSGGGSVGTPGQAATIGLAGMLGGLPGLVGSAVAAGNAGAPANGAAVNAAAQGDPIAFDMAASIGGVGPGPDSATDPSSVGAVNGMDAASDAAGGSGGGGK